MKTGIQIPVKFLDNHNNILYSQPLVFNETSYPERHDTLGKAYYSEGNLIDTPNGFFKEKQDKPRRPSSRYCEV